MHYYATANPHCMHTIDHQKRWSLNVWWERILRDQVIGSLFFDDVFNGVRYREFLQNDLPLLVENVDLDTRRTMWLQQDGAPVYFHLVVQEWNVSKSLDRQSTSNQFACSFPNLTSIDFFLWGFVIEVYKVRL